MDGGREGRRVGEVHRVEVLHARLLVESRHHDVGDLVHGAGAQHLYAEQAVRTAVRDELYQEARGAGVVVGLVVHHGDHAHRVEARLARRRLGEAGATAVERGQQAHDSGSERAGVGRRRAREHAGDRAAADVGRRAHGAPERAAGDGVRDLGAVAGGVDVGHVGGAELVHDDAAAVERHAGALEPRRVGPDANGEDHKVRRQRPRADLDALDLGAALDARERARRHDAHAGGLELALREAGHLGVKDVGQDLRHRVDHGDGEAACE